MADELPIGSFQERVTRIPGQIRQRLSDDALGTYTGSTRDGTAQIQMAADAPSGTATHEAAHALFQRAHSAYKDLSTKLEQAGFGRGRLGIVDPEEFAYGVSNPEQHNLPKDWNASGLVSTAVGLLAKGTPEQKQIAADILRLQGNGEAARRGNQPMDNSTQTVSDLGKLVKSKHPGSYDQIPDDQLGRQVQTKFPGSYDQFKDAPAGGSEHSIGGFLSNAIDSGKKFAGDVAGAVRHPVDTMFSVVDMLQGGAEKLVGLPPSPKEQAPKPGATIWERLTGPNAPQQTAGAVIDHFKQRYGSLDKAKEALYQDPVGVMADVSTVLDGAGVVADAAKLGKVAKVAATASEFTDPLRLTAKAAAGTAKLASKGADATATGLTRGALRGGFNVNEDAAKVAGAVDTAQTVRPAFSEKGLKDITAALDDLQKQKEAVTAKGAAAGMTIDPAKVEARIDEVRNKRSMQVNDVQDLNQIDKVRENYRDKTTATTPARPASTLLGPNGQPAIPATPATSRRVPTPVDEAQALKEGTYANNKYGKEAPPQLVATAEAEKAGARALKEELETQLPELKGLNESQSKLLDLEGILSKAVNKHTNSGGFWGNLAKNTIASKEGALKVAGVVGAGAAVHEPVAGAAVALMQAVLSDPAVKMRLATAINQAQKLNPAKFGTPSMRAATARVADLAGAMATTGSRVNAATDQPPSNAIEDAASRQRDVVAERKAKLLGKQ